VEQQKSSTFDGLSLQLTPQKDERFADGEKFQDSCRV
jgi:hypothetical protein